MHELRRRQVAVGIERRRRHRRHDRHRRRPQVRRQIELVAGRAARHMQRLAPQLIERRRHHLELGEAEVEELHLAAVAHHRVRQLDVAVQHALAVRRRQAPRQADPEPQRLAPRQRQAELRQALPADILGDQIRPPVELTDAVHRHHVRVLDPRRRPRLDHEALAGVALERRDELDRHRPIEHPVMRQVHLPHRALAEQANESVLVELLWRVPRVVTRHARSTSAGR